VCCLYNEKNDRVSDENNIARVQAESPLSLLCLLA
jgi:hypothetical protein